MKHPKASVDVRHEVAERARERAVQFRQVFVQSLPDEDELDEVTILGTYSYALQESRQRLIRNSIEIEPGIRETPPAASRDYLRIVYKKGPVGTRSQHRKAWSLPPEPNVAMPQKFLFGAYVDIKACYWSVMQIVGWNVDYNPGVWLSPGRAPYDYPFPDHKIGRNSLVSAGMLGYDPNGERSGIPIYNPHKLPDDPHQSLPIGNPLRNFQLPRLLHDVLNAIAYQALQAGAIYANKDGFIAPTPGIAQRVQGIITDWGLESTVKAQGSGEVKASGTYWVGRHKTLNYERVAAPIATYVLVELPYIKWLQQQFAYFASEKETT